MRRLITYMLCGLVMAACTEYETYNGEHLNIQLRASAGNLSTATKAPVEAAPWRGTVPDEDNPLHAKILLSTESGCYRPDPTSTNFLPCHTHIEYRDNSFQDPAEVTYTPGTGNSISGRPKYPTTRDAQNNVDKVFCTGLYPLEGWSFDSGYTVATHEIDGRQDIMYASEINGSSEDYLDAQLYSHMLAWIKVCVCATDRNASDKWGDIEKVEIRSNSQISIDLKTGETDFTTGKPYCIHETVTPLETTVTQTGSIFCAPDVSYTLTLKTTNSTQAHQITIKRDKNNVDAMFEAGDLYVLEVYFDMEGAEGGCTLIPWDFQDENLNLK